MKYLVGYFVHDERECSPRFYEVGSTDFEDDAQDICESRAKSSGIKTLYFELKGTAERSSTVTWEETE